MKIPVPPPAPWEEMVAKMRQSGRLVDLLALPLVEDEGYEPWEWFKYHQPPEGLTSEEWWTLVRMRRAQHARSLPLQMLDGRPLSYNVPDELLKAIEESSALARGAVELPEAIVNSGTKDRYLIRSLIEEAITSSQLEGASTSRRRAKEMIRHRNAPQDRSEQMILNNFHAMEMIVDLKNERLTPDLIMEIHRAVTRDTLDDPEDSGRIQRPGDRRVRVYGTETDDQILHIPPRAELLPGRLEALCRFANSEEESKQYVPPLVRSMALHFMMGYDHYFADGNGRTARAIFYWFLLHHGFFLAEYLSISRILKKAPAKYARSFLIPEQDEGDVTYFFLAQARAISQAIEDLHRYLQMKSESVRQAGALLRGAGLNHRQVSLIDSLLRDPSEMVSVEGHRSTHGVSTQTARTDLQDLENRGLLTFERHGRRHVWFAAQDLEEKIRELPRD